MGGIHTSASKSDPGEAPQGGGEGGKATHLAVGQGVLHGHLPLPDLPLDGLVRGGAAHRRCRAAPTRGGPPVAEKRPNLPRRATTARPIPALRWSEENRYGWASHGMRGWAL